MKTDILKYKRNLPPADFSLKIGSYTLLSESKSEKYDTCVFEAGGHKWRLSLYPNGDKKNNGNGYISLYLIIVETDSYTPGWEVNVNFKFLVYDKMEDKYLTIQDGNGAVRRFHDMKKEWGVAQLLPLETFKNPCFGYLVNDSCLFGVDIFVLNYTRNWESISLAKAPKNGIFTWKMEKYSKLNQLLYYSKVFNVEGINWKLMVYPNGGGDEKDKSLSIYICREDWGSHPAKEAIYAEYNLKVLDQLTGIHVERKLTHWFNDDSPSWGHRGFMSLSDLRDASKGFILKDTLIVEVVFLAIFVTKVSCVTKRKGDQGNNSPNSSKKRN